MKKKRKRRKRRRRRDTELSRGRFIHKAAACLWNSGKERKNTSTLSELPSWGKESGVREKSKRVGEKKGRQEKTHTRMTPPEGEGFGGRKEDSQVRKRTTRTVP